MLDELFAQHPLPWRFDEQPDADGIVAVRDASGASVLLCSDTPAQVQLGRAIAALPEVLALLAAFLKEYNRSHRLNFRASEIEQIRATLDKAGVGKEG